MSKLISYQNTTLTHLLNGAKKLYDAVSPTLSPLGDNVAMMVFQKPFVHHDGVTTAEEVFLEDPFEDIGAQIIKGAAIKTNSDTGDGTTTATILAYHLLLLGKGEIEKGYKSKKLRQELLEAKEEAVEILKTLSNPITKDEDIERIAIISAQDEKLGKLIGQAYIKLGKTGIILPEEGSGTQTEVNYKEGMRFNEGFVSHYFITSVNGEAVSEDPLVFVTDKKYQNVDEMAETLEALVKKSNNFVIIADDIVGDAMKMLVSNHFKGRIKAIGIKAPEFGKHKQETLRDIATLTGGELYEEISGPIETFSGFGTAEKVIATENETTIIAKADVSDRVKDIEEKLAVADSDYDKVKLQERLARLTSGIATILVGAPTEIEMKEKKEQVIDAINATRSALEEGIVPGGTITYINISSALSETKKTVGKEVLINALLQPFGILLKNSGVEVPKDGVIGDNQGIDVTDGKIKDLVKAGIIDPSKVIRMVLENSVSVAGQLLTTSTLITDEPIESSQ